MGGSKGTRLVSEEERQLAEMGRPRSALASSCWHHLPLCPKLQEGTERRAVLLPGSPGGSQAVPSCSPKPLLLRKGGGSSSLFSRAPSPRAEEQERGWGGAAFAPTGHSPPATLVSPSSQPQGAKGWEEPRRTRSSQSHTRHNWILCTLGNSGFCLAWQDAPEPTCENKT